MGRLLQHVKRKLHGVSLTEFLEADLRETKASEQLRNPQGYYVKLASELWQRSLVGFFSGAYAFRYQTGFLHLPAYLRRSHA